MEKTTNLILDPNEYYFISARYYYGDYSFVDKETGELREGTTDKWVLNLLAPLDPNEAKLQHHSGSHTLVKFDIKGKDNISYIFGKEPKDFKAEMLNDYIGAIVMLSFTFKNDTPKLRGIRKV